MKIVRWATINTESGFSKWHAERGNWTLCGKKIPNKGIERDERTFQKEIEGFPYTTCNSCFL